MRYGFFILKGAKTIKDYSCVTGTYSKFFVKIYDCLNEEYNGIKLKQSDKILFGFVDYSCTLNNRKCIWSNRAFTENTGLSESQVKKSLNNLEDAELIERIERGNGRTIKIVGNDGTKGTFLKMYTEVTRNKKMTLMISLFILPFIILLVIEIWVGSASQIIQLLLKELVAVH